jgi:type IV pilus assembly protein PilA
MLKSISTRLHDKRVAQLEGEGVAEAGFTLIELMVVLLIIAILLAIAIPTFLGVTGSANDRAAQSNLTNALTEAKALYQNGQSYASGTLPLGTFNSSAPEFTWITTSDTTEGTNTISIQPVDLTASGDGAGIILATYSKTGTCWYVADLEATPATVGSDTSNFNPATSGTNAEEVNAGTALNQAGVYYAKATVGGTGNPATCNASTPITAGPWKWNTTYSNASNL